MKTNLFFTLLSLLTISISSSQNIFSTKYKIVDTTNENKKEELENLFLNSMIYNFYSNEKLCYLNETTTLNTEGVNSKVSGQEHIYIDYNKKIGSYKLTDAEFFSYEKLTFKKLKSNIKILGMNTTKYISADGNIVVYTSNKIPWFVQPCVIISNQFNEGIVKFENLKTKIGFELIELKKIKQNKNFNDIQTKFASFKVKNVETIVCPFFKLE